jgi:hypothetical protein
MTMVATIAVMSGGRLHHESTAKIRGWRALFAFSLAALWTGTTALDATSLGALQVVSGDPFLVIAFGACCNSRAVSVDVDGLGLFDGFLAGALLLLLELGEIREHPDVIEGVADTDGTGDEEEV